MSDQESVEPEVDPETVDLDDDNLATWNENIPDEEYDPPRYTAILANTSVYIIDDATMDYAEVDMTYEQASDLAKKLVSGEAQRESLQWKGAFEGANSDEPHPDLLHGPSAGEDPTFVLIIGSYGWEDNQLPLAILQQHWNKLGNPPLVLYTSGCPKGPEAVIAKASSVISATHAPIRDEVIPGLKIDLVLAFIKDDSEGATRALNMVPPHVPRHVFREYSPVDTSGWASR